MAYANAAAAEKESCLLYKRTIRARWAVNCGSKGNRHCPEIFFLLEIRQWAGMRCFWRGGGGCAEPGSCPGEGGENRYPPRGRTVFLGMWHFREPVGEKGIGLSQEVCTLQSVGFFFHVLGLFLFFRGKCRACFGVKHPPAPPPQPG